MDDLTDIIARQSKIRMNMRRIKEAMDEAKWNYEALWEEFAAYRKAFTKLEYQRIEAAGLVQVVKMRQRTQEPAKDGDLSIAELEEKVRLMQQELENRGTEKWSSRLRRESMSKNSA